MCTLLYLFGKTILIQVGQVGHYSYKSTVYCVFAVLQLFFEGKIIIKKNRKLNHHKYDWKW